MRSNATLESLQLIKSTVEQHGPMFDEEDLAAITAFNARYLGAINDEDIATLSSLTDEGHIMITPGRPPLIGKAANDAANGRAFQTVNIVETWRWPKAS